MDLINTFALYIGYAVMVNGAAAITFGCALAVLNMYWKIWRKGFNAFDILEATEEWRKNHPERFEKWKKRNRIED